jgi:integrase
MVMKNTNTENERDAFITKKGKGVRVYRPFDTRDGRRVPRDYYEFRIARNGRRVKFRLPGNKRDAGPRADEIAAFLADSRNTLEQAFELFCPERVQREPEEPEKVDPTVGQIIQRFTEHSVELQPSTLAAYTGAIRRIAGFLHKPKPLKRPKTKDHAKWLEAVDSVKFSLFTPEALENFRASMIKQAGSDLQKIESAKISANACMRNAAGLFGRRMLKYYKDFDIHDPIPFREVGMLKERHPRYHSTFDIRDILVKAKEELRDSDTGAYFMVLLAAYAGLRRGEISALTWDQIDFENFRIWIHTTTEFRPKAANSEYPVDIPEELANELMEYRAAGIEEHYVLPGSFENRRLRCRQLTKVVTTWLRKQGIQDKKPLHALRKEAGSFIFRKTGSIDKASRFLRNDRKTAERHYVGQTERLLATYD